MTVASDTENQRLSKSDETGAAVAPVPKQKRARLVFTALAVTAVLGSGSVYAVGLGKESTDDAQVEGRVISVSSRVVGQIAKVAVVDNQLVDAGRVLIELDPADYEQKLQAALADLASALAAADNARASLMLTEQSTAASLTQALGSITQASSTVASTKASIEQASAELASAEARRSLAELNLKRSKNLLADGSTPQNDVDQRQAEYDMAAAAVAQSIAHRDSAKANVNVSFGSVTFAEGRLAAAKTAPNQIASAAAAVKAADAKVRQAEATKRLAELNLSYTRIVAPRRGLVSRRSAEEGQTVAPERPLLAIVPIDDVWIIANFKEDQLAEMKPGQPASVRLDTYGRRVFRGHVESVSAGAGARFALLPPDNASGNFVKVVQRVPVLIRLDAAADVELRPGTSAFVTVRTDGKAL